MFFKNFLNCRQNSASFINEENTAPTILSFRKGNKDKIRRIIKEPTNTQNKFMDTSVSNYSKFFDDFSKLKSTKTLAATHKKDARSMQCSNIIMDSGYLTNKDKVAYWPAGLALFFPLRSFDVFQIC